MLQTNRLALEIVLALFANDPIPTTDIPVVALAVLESTPSLCGAGVEEMLLLHKALCEGLLAKNALQEGSVN